MFCFILGLSLSVSNLACILVDPDFPQASALRTWYKNTVRDERGVPEKLTEIMQEVDYLDLADASERAIDIPNGKVIFETIAVVEYINNEKGKYWYDACDQCRKKVRDGACPIHNAGKHGPRYKLEINLNQDVLEGVVSAIAFDGVGSALFDMPAEDLVYLEVGTFLYIAVFGC